MNKQSISLTETELSAWWERVPGARRFLKKMANEAEHSRAIVADLPEDNVEGFITIFTEEIQRRNYSTIVDRYELNDDNCSEEDFITDLAIKFNPDYVPDLMSNSIIMDVASKKILHSYVIFVKVNEKINWLNELVTCFNRVEIEDKGTIIFITSETMPSQISMKLTDYITPYDVQFFAINLLEDTDIIQNARLYIATLVSKLVGTSAEMIKKLAKKELYTYGVKFAKTILPCEYFPHKFERAVWETQIQFALPIVEKIREKLIEDNLQELQKLLPLKDEFGKTLENTWDMELRHLHYYGGKEKIFEKPYWDKLEFAYKIRNELSHLHSIDTERLSILFGL